MATAADPATEMPKKKSKIGMILGVLLLLTGGGGGFFAVQKGLIGGHPESDESASAEDPMMPLPAVAYVALDPLIVNLPAGGQNRHLRFTTQLEVPPERVIEVEAVKPRIVDVLNGYLRAVETADLEDPTALIRLRSQMLRRVQVVAGEGRVRDLLIMEFVLN